MYKKRPYLIACGALLLASCSTISEQAKQELAQPVNCQTAQQDIATLESEKASVGKQVVAGAGSIVPTLAVTGILMGDYKNRVQVATGKYNDDIEAKITEIRRTCGIPAR
jgi:hypothetical protein